MNYRRAEREIRLADCYAKAACELEVLHGHPAVIAMLWRYYRVHTEAAQRYTAPAPRTGTIGANRTRRAGQTAEVTR